MNRLATLAACIAFPLMAQSTTIQPTTPGPSAETRAFALKDGGRLKVENINGIIEVSAWDKNEVELVAKFKPSSNDGRHMRLDVKSDADSFELVASYPKNPEDNSDSKERRRNQSCDIVLSVPRHVQASLKTANGGIAVNGTNGETTLETNNGSIAINDTKGKLVANTTNGSISLNGASGYARASTVNGSISGSLDGADGLDLSTVNGSIKIKLLNPNGTLEARTMNGSVKLNAPVAKDANTKKNYASARFGDGNAKMSLETVNGSVVIDLGQRWRHL